MQVNILEAKNHLSQLIKSAQAGEEVVIANRGEPVARLVPTQGTDRPGSGHDFLQWLDENPLPAFAQRSHEEIERFIQEERNAWD
ncbi:MAG: type II toxin-antitoxin system Phd/YefM family antitoxin [Rhodocyclales bacterium]|nr:type II toxin-antitoxin system Phd/YefM family antitoxin [Rhodocyclales bacterium]